jgi:membrane-bound ClpP family serine protease
LGIAAQLFLFSSLGVTTFGDFIEKGKKIKVSKINGATIFVEEIKEA